MDIHDFPGTSLVVNCMVDVASFFLQSALCMFQKTRNTSKNVRCFLPKRRHPQEVILWSIPNKQQTTNNKHTKEKNKQNINLQLDGDFNPSEKH